jgi:hypothetical protein
MSVGAIVSEQFLRVGAVLPVSAGDKFRTAPGESRQSTAGLQGKLWTRLAADKCAGRLFRRVAAEGNVSHLRRARRQYVQQTSGEA